MNISLTYLTFSLLTSSPILSYPILSSNSQKKFINLHISKLFSPFYYRSSLIQSSGLKKYTQYFINSKFEHFLNRAIEIDSNNVLSYQTPLGRSIFSLEFTNINNCIFKYISNPTNFGGALMTFAGVEIENSLFLSCFAQEGGAISCHEDFLVNQVTFQDCGAKSESGAFDRRTGSSKYKCNIKLSTFIRCKAEYFGAFHNDNNRGSLNVKYDNISKISANQCVGCFETSGCTSNFEFMIISESSAKVHNGCIVIRDPKILKFNYCLFYKCSHSSFVSDAGAVLLCYDNPSDSSISNSLFIHNKPSDSFTLTVASGHSSLKIFNSFFTGDENKEINHNGNILIDDQTVKFNYNCQSDIFDSIDFDKNEEDDNINKWKKSFKSNLDNNTIGFLTISFKDHDAPENDNLDDINVDELINLDDNESQDFFIIHFIAILLALLGAFLLQNFTNYVAKLYQSNKNSRENE